MNKDFVYTQVLGNAPGQRIGIVKVGETGYYATNLDNPTMSKEDVTQTVDYLNNRLGIPSDVAESAAFASCFGWDKPVAVCALRFFAAQ